MIKFILHNIPVRKFNVQVVNLAPNELLKGRVTLIIGGTSGIGFHTTEAFLHSGDAVIVTRRSEEHLLRACSELRKNNDNEGDCSVWFGTIHR